MHEHFATPLVVVLISKAVLSCNLSRNALNLETQTVKGVLSKDTRQEGELFLLQNVPISAVDYTEVHRPELKS